MWQFAHTLHPLCYEPVGVSSVLNVTALCYTFLDYVYVLLHVCECVVLQQLPEWICISCLIFPHSPAHSTHGAAELKFTLNAAQ